MSYMEKQPTIQELLNAATEEKYKYDMNYNNNTKEKTYTFIYPKNTEKVDTMSGIVELIEDKNGDISLHVFNFIGTRIIKKFSIKEFIGYLGLSLR